MKVAVTTGDPAGIGPDIALALGADQTKEHLVDQLVLIGDRQVLAERAELLGSKISPEELPMESSATPNPLQLAQVTADAPAAAGRADPHNARYVLAQIDAGIAGCRDGAYDALVTAPVNKAVINQAGIAFSGHTEYLADACGCDTVMMLVCETLRVALATTHLPLSAVAQALTCARLERTLRVVDQAMRRMFGIDEPRIAVCGLNPHAGEDGHLGHEETQIIRPVLDQLSATMNLNGPLPADTAFTPRQLTDCDAVVAMYHDQGLPVIKHAGFGNTVNITLGLPFVRTSVDHGTAFDLAGTGRASAASLRAAVVQAGRLADNLYRHAT